MLEAIRCCLTGLLLCVPLNGIAGDLEFDPYGGVRSMKGVATGAFHLEQFEGRHCLVTPDGHAFPSLGINHIQAISQKGTPDLFQEKYGRDWRRVSEGVLAELRQWGFNTAGYGSPAPLCRRMPYMAASYLEKTSNYLPDSEFFYPDVFDPKVQEEKRKILRHLCRDLNNPNLIGYYWTDTPQWDLKRARKKRGTDWVSALRGLPDEAPGRKRYEQYVAGCKERGVPPDDEGFLRLIAREHYRVMGEETRRLHPGALIFGERYLMRDHPDVVLEEALPHIDVLSIQPGGSGFDGPYFDRLHAKTGKPILLCDHQCSFATPDHPKTMWQQLGSEEAVGKAYARYLKDALEKPYIIGYHRCQYIDRFAEHPGVLKQGIIRQDGTSYKTLVRHIREANAEAIQRFSGNFR